MKSIIFPLVFLCTLLCTAQSETGQDFLEARIEIIPDTLDNSIRGTVQYTFLSPQGRSTVELDAVNMDFTKIRLDGKKVRYQYNGKELSFPVKGKAGQKFELLIEYNCKPRQTVYFLGWGDGIAGNNQIWTQGQGKYTSHWLPSFDNMKEKVIFDLSVSFDTKYEVAANGELVGNSKQGQLSTWQFNMDHPMSSYLLAFAIGEYTVEQQQTKRGVPLIYYYYPEDSLKVEPTYRYSREIFDFLESELKVDYPWPNYRQVPVRDFLYAGMENTACTLFSDSYLIDSIAFNDRNYVNINAHEMAHQWFGNLVTETSGHHHWLHEGFATYYAYLAEKNLFGDEYFYWRLYETAKALNRMSEESGGEALTDPSAGSLTFYEKGAWALHMLRDLVGETSFKQGMTNYLLKYSYKNVTIEQFLEVMEEASGKSLSDFQEEWLVSNEFPFASALQNLTTSCSSLKKFLELQHELVGSTQPNEPIIKRYWEAGPSAKWKEMVVETYFSSLSNDFLLGILRDGDLQQRRAVAVQMVQIPPVLKEEFEGLLTDKSYVTREAALYKLWIHFKEDRPKYLEQTRDVYGFPNRNIRLLWLTLALLTPRFDESRQTQYMEELRGYTSPRYGYETRQLAFEYLKEAFELSENNLRDLVDACVHPSWQFRSFARNLLGELLERADYRERILKLREQLKGEELRYINDKLNTQ